MRPINRKQENPAEGRMRTTGREMPPEGRSKAKKDVYDLCERAKGLGQTGSEGNMRLNCISEIARDSKTALEVYKETTDNGTKNIILKAFETAVDTGRVIPAEANVIVAKKSIRMCSRINACMQLRGNVEAMVEVAIHTIYDDTAEIMLRRLGEIGEIGAVHRVSCERPKIRDIAIGIISEHRVGTEKSN